jgi:hypothetical protein
MKDFSRTKAKFYNPHGKMNMTEDNVQGWMLISDNIPIAAQLHPKGASDYVIEGKVYGNDLYFSTKKGSTAKFNKKIFCEMLNHIIAEKGNASLSLIINNNPIMLMDNVNKKYYFQAPIISNN